MSPSVGNFVHDLVEMAKAMEELPFVQAECNKLRRDNDAQGATIAAREESIQRLKAEIETLQAKVRDAEANRDDAELRFLELDEKAGKVIHLLEAVGSSAKAATELLIPPKEPEPVPGRVADVRHDYDPGIATNPTPQPQTQTGGGASDGSSPQGQSEPHPTTATDPIGSEAVAHGGAVHTTENANGQPEGVSVQSDPSSPAASTTGSTHTTASSPDAANPASAPEDDVGYHNEPEAKWSKEWYNWANRMDAKYGVMFWPAEVS